MPTFFIVIVISTGFVELGNVSSSLPPPGKTPNPYIHEYRCIGKAAKGLNKEERANLGGSHPKSMLQHRMEM